MVNAARRAVLIAGALSFAMPTIADDSLPDAEFLEYLGSWNESDEDWLVLADEEGLNNKDLASDSDEQRLPDIEDTDENYENDG